MGVGEEGGWEQERPEKENGRDLDSEKDCEITNSEELELIQANTPSLEIPTARSQVRGAFNSAFTHQREPEPSERTQFR